MTTAARACAWCGGPVGRRRRDAEFCSQRCRQAAFRTRRRSTSRSDASPLEPVTFAYADPPYPGKARKCYGREEVDHVALIASLMSGGYAGWALSTSARALRAILPLCPPDARVCPWTKPLNPDPRAFGPTNRWEPVIVVGGRIGRMAVRDWLNAAPARGGGDLIGRKPLAFCAWLWDLFNAQPGDQLVDLFPGTGVVTRAWRELSFRSSKTEAVAQDVLGDASPDYSVTGGR